MFELFQVHYLHHGNFYMLDMFELWTIIISYLNVGSCGKKKIPASNFVTIFNPAKIRGLDCVESLSRWKIAGNSKYFWP